MTTRKQIDRLIERHIKHTMWCRWSRDDGVYKRSADCTCGADILKAEFERLLDKEGKNA